MNKKWTQAEEDFVMQSAELLTDKQGAAELSKISGRNITVDAWRKKRQHLKIKKKPGRGVCAVVEDETLVESCPFNAD